MKNMLAGKTALITGAAQGIGRSAAEMFLEEGAILIATDLNVSKLAGLGGAALRQLDVTDDMAIRALAAEAGSVDILFNCAGIVPTGTVLDSSDSDWLTTFDVNVFAIARMIRAFLPGMLEKGGGSIINVASVAGSMKGLPNRCAYGASKAAVIGLTKAVAADYVTKGVRCNAVCPGTVDSPSLRQRWTDTGDYEAARTAFIARQAMGRLGKPEEIASLVVWLASDASAFATGQAFAVDGGITI